MGQVFSNYAISQLASAMSAVATTMVLTPLDGGKFTAPIAGDYELVGITDGVNWEIVKMTARTNDTCTVERGYEGTAQAWETGAVVKSTATKDTMENFIQRGEYESAIDLVNYLYFK